jgi:hypothetical protein
LGEQRLNQVVAIEKGIKNRVCAEISRLHKLNQKSELFNGFIKNYTPKDDDGEQYPTESKRVQLSASDAINEFAKALSQLLDIEATKDYANCNARADVVVDGAVLLGDAPTTYLLFLEKQIADIRTYIEKLPVLDDSEAWDIDVNTGLYKTDTVKTHRTKKVQKPVVLYDATDRHPAQTQMITEDITVGYWNIVKQSGAIPVPEIKKLVKRIDKLSAAVKFAREKANSIEAVSVSVGDAVFGYLFD